MRRVVVTGLGMVTGVGTGREEFWSALLSGRNGIDRLRNFDPAPYTTQIGCEVRDWDPSPWLEAKLARRCDKFSQFALAAAALALDDSGLELERENRERIGVFIGSGNGGCDIITEQARVLFEKGPNRLSPLFVPMLLVNMAAAHVSIRYGLKGPLSSLSTACATGLQSVGDAAHLIRLGKAEAVFAGGSEACVSPLAFGGFCATRAMSRRNDDPARASRPFDRQRDGFVMGEGAAVAILESLEHARARRAEIYAEVVGYAQTADAHHLTAPEPEVGGFRRAMSEAVAEAGVTPAAIDHINAHGTSTPLNDYYESLAIEKVFGPATANVLVTSTKSMMGHLMGAAGAVEFVATALTVKHDRVPPTINLEEQDPECRITLAANEARARPVNYALCNAFGFGGVNACLALKKFTD